MKLKRVTFKRPLYGTTFTVEPGPNGSIELLEGLQAVRISTPADCMLVPWTDVAHAEPCDPVQEVVADCIIESSVVDHEVKPVVVDHARSYEVRDADDAQPETMAATPSAKRNRSRR